MVKSGHSKRGRPRKVNLRKLDGSKNSSENVSNQMVKTGHSKRGRPRKVDLRKRAKPKKSKNVTSSESETSPFKGFDDNQTPSNRNSPDPEQLKEDLFDKLLDNNDTPPNLHKNIRTYSNKNKSKRMKDKGLLEFSDCKNRDDILKWLCNTQNVFDRLSQTQTFSQNSTFNSQDEIDMPSVSQRDITNKKHNKSHTKERKATRSSYRLRAKSLDVTVKKNVCRGRNERHSLAGDSPLLENYQIEEFTGEDVVIPAEKEAEIIDLMEDELIDNLEREMLEKKNTGWDRINDVNKSINCAKKQPKQLKITVTTPEKHNNNSYDNDALECYFVENMRKLLEDDENKDDDDEKNVLDAVERILVKEGSTFLKKLEALIGKVKSCDRNHIEIQTSPIVDNLNKSIQNVVDMTNKGQQTESDTIHTSVQTDTIEKTFEDKNIQTEVHLVIREAPETSNPVQTDLIDTSFGGKNLQKKTESHASDPIFLNDEDRQNLCDEFSTNFDTENPPTARSEDDVFDGDDAIFQLNTEEFLKQETVGSKRGNVPSTTTKPVENESSGSVLVITEENVSKGVKRAKCESPINEAGPSRCKRPCAKFIKDDLSVDFSTCEDEGSDDVNYEEYLKNIIKRSKKPTPESPPSPKSRTQEDIEHLEDVIHNAIKPKHITPSEQLLSPTSKTPADSSKSSNYSDYFQSFSHFPDQEKTPKKSRRNLFNSKRDSCTSSESMFLSADNNNTVVINRTVTEDNVNVDKEVEDILKPKETKVNILQNVVVRDAVDNDIPSQLSDVDVVESTPVKKYRSSVEQREESELDITLPPPLEFQDSEKPHKIPNSPRRPLAIINKVTSTPFTQRYDSERLTLSPIKKQSPEVENTPVKPKAASFGNKKKITIVSNRVLGPLELAQQSKFSPLTIIKRPPSQSFVAPKQQKSILNYVRSSQESQTSQSTKPCVACSRVSKEHIIAINSMANKKLVSYSASFSPKVTHLIVSISDKNCLKDQTIKYIAAVASGIWVLSFGWVRECLFKNTLVPEEPYEVLDVSGIPGPQKSRLSRTTNPLLKGFKIYAAPPFVSTTQQEVENVVRLLGGKVVSSPEALLEKKGQICVIITEAKATQDFELYETWLEALRVVTLDIEWLSRSVGQYQLLSFRPFTLCSDEYLANLGYPQELTVNMTYSFSQQTFSTVPSTT